MLSPSSLFVMVVLSLTPALCAPSGAAPADDAEVLRKTTAAALLHERSVRHYLSPRTRRSAHQPHLRHHSSLHARDAADLALCKYSVRVESHEESIEDGRRRVPATITEIECRAQGCRCTPAGDYRCTQLTTVVQVAYVDSETGRLLETGRRDVRAGCVCAVKAALHGHAHKPTLDE